VFYGVAALVLGAGLLRKAVAMWRADDSAGARPLFFFTIMYLFLIFAALLADRALQTALQTIVPS
jgi:protoheme IX farnesyltransferase